MWADSGSLQNPDSHPSGGGLGLCLPSGGPTARGPSLLSGRSPASLLLLGSGRGRPVVFPAPHSACLCLCAPSPGPPGLSPGGVPRGRPARPAHSRPFHVASMWSFLPLPSSQLCCGHRTRSPLDWWTRPARSCLSSRESFVLIL